MWNGPWTGELFVWDLLTDRPVRYHETLEAAEAHCARLNRDVRHLEARLGGPNGKRYTQTKRYRNP